LSHLSPATTGTANLIIAGVNKAGTTSLFHYLSDHPSVCGSRDKETCYFLPLLYGKPVAPLSEYRAQFSNCGQQPYRLEATPAYIFGGAVIADAVNRLPDDVRVIMLLKNPVERFISFYRRKKATLQLPESLTFDEYVKKCSRLSVEEMNLPHNQPWTSLLYGRYVLFLEPWLQLFGERIRVYFSDQLIRNPESLMKEICHWLEMDARFYDNYRFEMKNRSVNYRNRTVQRIAVTVNRAGQRFWRANPAVKQRLLNLYTRLNGSGFSNDEITPGHLRFLDDYYRPYNEHLARLLTSAGMKNLPAWLQTAKQPA
jgi:hypothetical protein